MALFVFRRLSLYMKEFRETFRNNCHLCKCEVECLKLNIFIWKINMAAWSIYTQGTHIITCSFLVHICYIKKYTCDIIFILSLYSRWCWYTDLSCLWYYSKLFKHPLSPPPPKKKPRKRTKPKHDCMIIQGWRKGGKLNSKHLCTWVKRHESTTI